MSAEIIIQYAAITASIAALIIKRRGMKKYIPVAFFAILYADIWCYIAKYYDFWSFPSKLFPFIKDISIPVNFFAVPVIAMFWVRYYPKTFREGLITSFTWTTILIIIEVLIGTQTNLLEYSSGFKWYHSYILWYLSLHIWRRFHIWFNY